MGTALVDVGAVLPVGLSRFAGDRIFYIAHFKNLATERNEHDVVARKMERMR